MPTPPVPPLKDRTYRNVQFTGSVPIKRILEFWGSGIGRASFLETISCNAAANVEKGRLYGTRKCPIRGDWLAHSESAESTLLTF
ncbi:hypothetical protein CB1_001679005 [Camelus ferus]|nr:hypothetical protein CB1_001679005 [Camelus ferus]